MDESDDAPAKWQDELYDLLRRNNVTQFAYVPDAGHRLLIDRSLADPQAHSVALTHRGGGGRAARRRRFRRRTSRPVGAEQRHRQLHQHAVADPLLVSPGRAATSRR